MISEVLLDLISRVDSIHSEKKAGGGVSRDCYLMYSLACVI